MTYPEARYHGNAGEISATYRPTSTAPDVTYSRSVEAPVAR